MTISILQRNVESILKKFDEIVVEAAYEHEEFITASNLSQLWDGKDVNNQNIRPSYLEDPYFKTQKAAERYAAWKFRITPNSNRDKNTPNLFINGYFYSSVAPVANSNFIQVITNSGFGKEVTSKFTNVLGLTKPHMAELARETKPDLLKKLKDEIHSS